MATNLKPQPGDEIKPDIKPDLGRGGEPSTGKQTESDHTEKSGQDIAGKEKTASNKDGQNTSTNNKEEELAKGPADDTVGKGWSPRNKKKKRTSTRKKITLIIATVGITGSIATAFISSPVFIINHLRDVLTSKVNELQNSQQRRYRRKKIARVSDAFSRDGRLGSRIMLEMEASGYRVHFDTDNRNKITGISRIDGTGVPNNNLGSAADEIEGFMEKRHPFRTSRWKTRRMNAFYRRFGIQRVPVVSNPRNVDIDNPDKELNKRIFSSVDGDSVSLEGRASTDLSDDATEKETTNRSAQEDIAKNSGDLNDAKDTLKDGTPISEGDELLKKIDDIGSGTVDEDLVKTLEKGAKTGLAGKTFGLAKGLFVTSDIADRTCVIKNRLRAAVTASRTFRSLSMMKYTSTFLGAADASRTGKVDSRLMGSLLKKLTKPDKNGNNIGASSGFSYALSSKFSKSKNDSTRSLVAVDGKLTGTYGAIQDKTNIKGCGTWQNPFFQIGAGIVEVGVSVFTFGAAKAALTGGKVAVTLAIKKSIAKASSKIVLKKIGRSVGISALVGLSFEGIMFLTQIYAEKSLNLNFTAQETGGQLGEILVGGAGTMSKQRNLLAGQVPATETQYAQAQVTYLAEKESLLKEQSFFSRVFDYNNVDSLAFSLSSTLAFSGNLGVSTAANSLFTGILNTPLSILGHTGNKAGAQDADLIAYDIYVTEGDNGTKMLATDPAGNLQTVMRSDIENVDPIENVDFLKINNYIDTITLEPIGSFEKHVINCVNSIDTISMIEGGNPDDPAEDCLADGANMAVTIRFKAHLAYIDMVDGLEAEFLPEEIDNSQGNVTDTSSSALGSKIVSRANQELNSFGGKLENTPAMCNQIQEYAQVSVSFGGTWNCTASNGTGPWSAIFISYVLRTAGVGGAFKYSASHSVYIKESINNLENGSTGVTLGYKPSNYSPQLGDLVCTGRSTSSSITYEEAALTSGYPSHCDIVIQKTDNEITVVGGNVANTVKTKQWAIDASGKITNSKVFVVIRMP